MRMDQIDEVEELEMIIIQLIGGIEDYEKLRMVYTVIMGTGVYIRQFF